MTKIAILGSNSRIAKDLILSFSKGRPCELFLFSRNISYMSEWTANVNLSKNYKVYGYGDFNNAGDYDVVVNFVGIGDPKKSKSIGSRILGITKKYDDMVLNYIKSHRQTKYIFISSGAVFGGDFQNPVDQSTNLDIEKIDSKDWYANAKLTTENLHRSYSNLFIVDLRVFNYFSHTQDINFKFLITDAVRAIKKGEVLQTSDINIVRDFITPPDFYNMIQSIVNCDSINMAIDCYTKNPVSKFDLLNKLCEKFGLKYQINREANIFNVEKTKINYYSKNKEAGKIGYKPQKSSLEGVIYECESLFRAE